MAEWGISQGMAADNIYVTRHPMKRMARLEDISDAVLFLASDAASFITGQVFVIDGGQLAGQKPGAELLAKMKY